MPAEIAFNRVLWWFLAVDWDRPTLYIKLYCAIAPHNNPDITGMVMGQNHHTVALYIYNQLLYVSAPYISLPSNIWEFG